ncbi:MAG: RluA family pseudouridine synthase [Boseongicola sp. SB0670_bin_30]|nr:RluA family pseudouridine synthase [Boseongicola sp. SB0670_bin_30]
MSRKVLVTIGHDPPSRLDKALARDAPVEAHLSRSRLARLLAEGAVSRDGTVVRDLRGRASQGQVYEVTVKDAVDTHMRPEDIPLSVVYEDADVVIIDKAAGMVVHPAPGAPSGTLVNALLHHFGDDLSGVGGERRPGIVHRIDKDTSGFLVVAKSDAAHHGLAAQFAAHSVERSYLALCHGVPEPGNPRLRGIAGVSFGTGGVVKLDTRIGRHRTDRKKQAVLRHGGRKAVTQFQAIETFGDHAALVRCRLQTGRTHQIRVHMAHIGHALIGDPDYGGRRRLPESVPGAAAANSFARQALHAATLGFVHPVSRQFMRFESPLPGDIAQVLDALRKT